MANYTIGELARRSGFTASTLRFYDQHGLLEPVRRTGAGYRIYDDSSLERLRFIARAKELGCTLEEISDLAELWADDECAPAQARLHELVTGKIADARRRSSELTEFTAQLQAAAAHLGDEPVDARCSEGCACLAGTGRSTRRPEPAALGDRAESQIACTLPTEAMPGRAEEWRTITGYVQRREPLGDGSGVRLLFDDRVPVAQLATLAVAEHGCCSFFDFAITVDDRGTALEVRAPDDAVEYVIALFGAPE